MTKIIDINDHRLLEEIARREGLTYRQYRQSLRKQRMPLEIAINNARTTILLETQKVLEEQNYKIRRLEQALQVIDTHTANLGDLYSRVEKLEQTKTEQKRKKSSKVYGFVKDSIAFVSAAGLALFIGVAAEHRYKFRSCEKVDNMDGTVTYYCPGEIACGSFKTWEGEKLEIISDGRKKCTYWIGGT